MGSFISFLINNWGSLASLAGLVIGAMTLNKVYSIAKARREEREELKSVLFIYDHHIFIEETTAVLLGLYKNILAEEKEFDRQYVLDALLKRVNVLHHASGALERALHALDILREGKKGKIIRSNFEKAAACASANQYGEAIDYLTKEIAFQKELSDEDSAKTLAKCYHNRSNTSLKASHPYEAVEDAQSSLDYAKESGEAQLIVNAEKLLDFMQSKTD